MIEASHRARHVRDLGLGNASDETIDRRAQMEDFERLIQSRITTLTAYRKSLIHECVTGKRRISEADVAKVEAHA